MLNDSVESFCVIYNKLTNKQTNKQANKLIKLKIKINNAIVDPKIFRFKSGQFLFHTFTNSV